MCDWYWCVLYSMLECTRMKSMEEWTEHWRAWWLLILILVRFSIAEFVFVIFHHIVEHHYTLASTQYSHCAEGIRLSWPNSFRNQSTLWHFKPHRTARCGLLLLMFFDPCVCSCLCVYVFVWLSVTTVNCETIGMAFVMWTRVSPRNHASDAGPIPDGKGCSLRAPHYDAVCHQNFQSTCYYLHCTNSLPCLQCELNDVVPCAVSVMAHVVTSAMQLIGLSRSPRTDAGLRQSVDHLTDLTAKSPQLTHRERLHVQAVQQLADGYRIHTVIITWTYISGFLK